MHASESTCVLTRRRACRDSPLPPSRPAPRACSLKPMVAGAPRCRPVEAGLKKGACGQADGTERSAGERGGGTGHAVAAETAAGRQGQALLPHAAGRPTCATPGSLAGCGGTAGRREKRGSEHRRQAVRPARSAGWDGAGQAARAHRANQQLRWAQGDACRLTAVGCRSLAVTLHLLHVPAAGHASSRPQSQQARPDALPSPLARPARCGGGGAAPRHDLLPSCSHHKQHRLIGLPPALVTGAHRLQARNKCGPRTRRAQPTSNSRSGRRSRSGALRPDAVRTHEACTVG